MTDQEFRKAPLEALVDIQNVKIDRSLPMEERIRSYVEQVKDPYHFRVGKVKVKVSYAKTDKTLTDIFCEMLPYMS